MPIRRCEPGTRQLIIKPVMIGIPILSETQSGTCHSLSGMTWPWRKHSGKPSCTTRRSTPPTGCSSARYPSSSGWSPLGCRS